MSAEVVRIIPQEPRYQIEEHSIGVFFKDGELFYAPKGREKGWEHNGEEFDVFVPKGHIGLILIQLLDPAPDAMVIEFEKPVDAFYLTKLSDSSFLIVDNNCLEANHGADLNFKIMVGEQIADPRVVNE